MGLGYLAKQAKKAVEEGRPTGILRSSVVIKVASQGLGRPPIPDPPETPAWVRLDVYVDGSISERARNITLRTRANDEGGKQLAIGTRWVDTQLYMYILPGYREAKGRIRLGIARGNGAETVAEIPALPSEASRYAVKLKPCPLPGIGIELKKVTGSGSQEQNAMCGLAYRATGKIKEHEMVLLRYEGTDLRQTQFQPDLYAVANPRELDQPNPTHMVRDFYLADARTVRFSVVLLRAHPHKTTLKWTSDAKVRVVPPAFIGVGQPLPERKVDPQMIQFDPFAGPGWNATPMAFVQNPDRYRVFLDPTTSDRIRDSLRVRLITPKSVGGLPVELHAGNSFWHAIQLDYRQAKGSYPKPKVGDRLRFEVELEEWGYDVVSQGEVVLPLDYSKLPAVDLDSTPELVIFRSGHVYFAGISVLVASGIKPLPHVFVPMQTQPGPDRRPAKVAPLKAAIE